MKQFYDSVCLLLDELQTYKYEYPDDFFEMKSDICRNCTHKSKRGIFCCLDMDNPIELDNMISPTNNCPFFLEHIVNK